MAELCDACRVEKIGCPCDGSLDDGCFLCTPEKHSRPPCPPECARFTDRDVVGFSAQALASVDAMLKHKGAGRTDAEKQFDAVVESCVFRTYEHAQMPPPEKVREHDGHRLYTVTVMAASARFGGTRVWTVCDTFERAKEIVEHNEGDIFETTYKLVVIDMVVAGWLYALTDEQYWYCWVGDYETGCYKAIDRPTAYEGQIGVGGVG